MSKEYLTRGVKTGVVARLMFRLFVAVATNPLVGYAGDLSHATAEESRYTHEAESVHSYEAEGAHSHESGDSHVGESGGHHDTVVSMAVTKAVSVVASGLWDAVFGGTFFEAVLFFLKPVIPGSDAAESYLMGFTGFVTVSGAPWLVLLPITPGAEQSLSTTTRLPFYAGMMFAGALACLSADYVYTRLRESRGLDVVLVGATIPFGLLAVLAVVTLENAVCGTLSPALETGLIGLLAFEQALLWLILVATRARFRSSSESEFGSGIPTAGRDSVPAAD